MQRLYVLGDGIYLKKRGDNLALVKDNETLEEVNPKSLREIVIMGYASLSGPVFRMLIENRVETVLLDPRGRFQGRLSIDEHKHVSRRRQQYLKLSDPEFLVKTAQAIVVGKIKTQSRFLRIRANQMKSEELYRAATSLRAMEKEFLSRSLTLEEIRGIEGLASKIYFDSFGKLISNPLFKFQGRTKRPPLDPVNAMLSFVYTLLTSEVLSAIKTVGLDPYLGALHAEEYGRPSLACDLVEEWRVFLCDRFVLGLINRNVVSPDNFVYKEVRDTDFVDEEDLRNKRPVEMKPNTLRAFLSSYENWMTQRVKIPESNEVQTYRAHILSQVRKFERYIMGEMSEYKTFPWSKIL